MRPKSYLSTRDLVVIALLSSLGGVLSTYVGYLGNLMNHVVGVPFGAGQFLAGLHVVWIILAMGLTRKKGVGTVTGLVKGTVELFTGSTHGIVIVVVSLVQGIVADTVLFSDRAKERRDYTSYAMAGGLSAAMNVLVFQAFFFSGVPWVLIGMLCMLAFASGMIFGGWLSIEMLETMEYSGMLTGKREIIVDDESSNIEHLWRKSRERKKRRKISIAVVASFLVLFSIGAVYYFAFIYVLPGEDTIEVNGVVSSPFDFAYDDFTDYETTIIAELVGSITYVEPREYTGVPLRAIITEAVPLPSASEVLVRGTDGYHVTFSLEEVLDDDELLVVKENGSFRIVGANYEGGYWVEQIAVIEVR
ncbi:MAG: ECF transporter S component [Methanobacteriota archaeon]|nr:MAG: ECF transporter S component [Euryarchaeota archaeon]